MSVLLSMLMAASIFDDSFDAATTAYNESNYAEAVTVLEQLVANGVVEPEVFYNLGNAYYRSGRLAHAIANYERALQLSPRLEGAQENLNTCIRQTERGLSKPQPPDWEQGLLFWHYDIPRKRSLGLALFAWCLLWALLAIRQVRRFPYLRRSALAMGLLTTLFAASWWVKSNPHQLAVAAQRGVPVRYGVSDTETVRFELYEGDRVAVDRRNNGWARVETAGGERGWTREEYLVFVGPPYERPSYRGTDAGPEAARANRPLEGVLPQRDGP